MPSISPLLDVQDLDLAGDRLAERRRTLPELEALKLGLERRAALDVAFSALGERLDELRIFEHDLVREVDEMAAKAKEVETTLYGGTVRASKELSALQEELRLLREKQSGVEEREMELLEEIERVELERSENRRAREESEHETVRTEAALGAAETAIDAELAEVTAKRASDAAGLPAAILAEYERLRMRDRLSGVAAAPLRDGGCGGCRIKLPVLDYSRMKAQPEDALLLCPRCGRMLVR